MTHKITAIVETTGGEGIIITLRCEAYREEYKTAVEDLKDVVDKLDEIFNMIHLTNTIDIALILRKSVPDD